MQTFLWYLRHVSRSAYVKDCIGFGFAEIASGASEDAIFLVGIRTQCEYLLYILAHFFIKYKYIR